MNPLEYNGNIINLYLVSLVPLNVSMETRIDPESIFDQRANHDLLTDVYDIDAGDRYVRIQISDSGKYKEKGVYVRITQPFSRVYNFDDFLFPGIFSVFLNLP